MQIKLKEMPQKFVPTLSDQQKNELDSFIEKSINAREIKRCNAILLSSKGLSINTISSVYEVDRDTVSRWIKWWTFYGTDGLRDDLHTGRTPKLDRFQQIEVIQIVKQEPRKIKLAVGKIKDRFGKELSVKTIKRILVKKNFDGNVLDNQ